MACKSTHRPILCSITFGQLAHIVPWRTQMAAARDCRVGLHSFQSARWLINVLALAHDLKQLSLPMSSSWPTVAHKNGVQVHGCDVPISCTIRLGPSNSHWPIQHRMRWCTRLSCQPATCSVIQMTAQQIVCIGL